MDAVELIKLYSTLFYVFLGIAALGLALAVFFFFYFDIPTIRAMMTGKAKQETIRRMEEKHAMTGNLRFQYPNHTGDISPRGQTGRMGRSGRIGNSGKLGNTGRTGKTGKLQVTTTIPMAVQQSEPETAILQNTAPETSILGSAAFQMQPQNNEELGQTAMLHPNTSGFQFEVTQSVVLIHTDEII